MADVKRIAVIGAGMMGHGIAQIFAGKGWLVSLTDVNEAILGKARESIRANLVLLAQNGIGRAEDVETALGRIKTTLSLEEAAADADLVIEAIAERLDLKQELFRKLDAMCPSGTILATNTSVISITEVAQLAENRRRIVGAHFWNPPYLVPLVEVVPGSDTSPQTVNALYDMLKEVGKHPVKVRRDVPGFVGNRLQHALWREAISIVDQGIADAATVDEVIKNSFGIRLPVLGPLETADMAGLDLTLQIHDYILRRLDRSTEPAPVLREKVDRGDLGFKTGKGFYEWNEESIGRCRKQLLEHLIAWTRRQPS